MTALWFTILISDVVIVVGRAALYGNKKVSKSGQDFFHDTRELSTGNFSLVEIFSGICPILWQEI
jgi:hypothetical protein